MGTLMLTWSLRSDTPDAHLEFEVGDADANVDGIMLVGGARLDSGVLFTLRHDIRAVAL